MSRPKTPLDEGATSEAVGTQERILASAHDIVSAKGFNGSGLNEILQRAGVPKGSFYHYFASKEALGVALIERARDEHLEHMGPLLSDRGMTPLQRLRAVFDSGFEECRDSGTSCECLIAKLALETSNLSDSVHAAVKGAYQQWSTGLAGVLKEGQAAGEIAARHDADHLANVLVMLWIGATTRMQIERSLQPLEDFLDFVFGTLLPHSP
ncbi:TetR/AcrR family transcriptional regulator [Engelhardtia mirabilis]|uniref:Transcriptional regulator AcuR n=1 Tax=Engelhardtia mirabilis TaxID=2528011 RepID=A0A518BHN2_9BACT|nr:Transcriptional regulator AcuR [Planctomycetes bacterium Pla133]QDV00790.1 Transcriptional regulator AcuR [Planctomycetes bacterium Pla86]